MAGEGGNIILRSINTPRDMGITQKDHMLYVLPQNVGVIELYTTLIK